MFNQLLRAAMKSATVPSINTQLQLQMEIQQPMVVSKN